MGRAGDGPQQRPRIVDPTAYTLSGRAVDMYSYFWAGAITLAPVPIAMALSRLFPDLGLVRFGIDVAAFAALTIPAALAIAIVPLRPPRP